MPRTLIPAVLMKDGNYNSTTTPGGVAADTVNGNSFDNDGDVFLLCRNGHASPQTVTVFYPVELLDRADGATPTIVNKTVSCAISYTPVLVGPFPRAIYSQGSDGGRVWVTASSASVLLQVFRMSEAARS